MTVQCDVTVDTAASQGKVKQHTLKQYHKLSVLLESTLLLANTHTWLSGVRRADQWNEQVPRVRGLQAIVVVVVEV